MDRGTPQNIMTELGITANEYNWVVTAYYVSLFVPTVDQKHNPPGASSCGFRN